MAGFLMLSRDIKSHWIFDDPEKLKAWLVILLEVNYSPKKSLIKGEVLTCEVGESLYSLDTWATKFGKGWNKSSVRRFFGLLKKDEMITLRSETVTTRLTVCNYLKYNKPCNADETQTKHRRNANDTGATPTKEMNKVEEGKKEDLNPLPANYQQRLFEEFYKAYPKKKSPADAEKAWKKIKPTEDQFSEIMAGLGAAKKSCEWKKENGKYIPYPASWLNARGWEDEHEEKQTHEKEDPQKMFSREEIADTIARGFGHCIPYELMQDYKNGNL